MPAYFSVEVSFKKDILYPDLVKDIYSIFFKSGYQFKSGFWFGEKMTLDEIIQWNQNHLQNKFKLGFTQHVKYDYQQILLDSNNYSEMRLFWMYKNDRIELNLIIPKYDILQYSEKITFIEDKIHPIITIAKNLWNTAVVSAIQACVEFDGGAVEIEKLKKVSHLSYTHSVS